MTGDYLMAAAVISGLLAIPSLLASYADGRTPIMSGVLALICVVFVVVAFQVNPGGYRAGEIPMVFIRVIGVILN